MLFYNIYFSISFSFFMYKYNKETTINRLLSKWNGDRGNYFTSNLEPIAGQFRATLTCKIVGRSFSIFWKISPPISLYYDPFLIKNLYKATNPPPLIKATPFCAYDLTGRYSLVFFKLTPLPLIQVKYE